MNWDFLNWPQKNWIVYRIMYGVPTIEIMSVLLQISQLKGEKWRPHCIMEEDSHYFDIAYRDSYSDISHPNFSHYQYDLKYSYKYSGISRAGVLKCQTWFLQMIWAIEGWGERGSSTSKFRGLSGCLCWDSLLWHLFCWACAATFAQVLLRFCCSAFGSVGLHSFPCFNWFGLE